MNIDELWRIIYEDDTVTIDVKKSFLSTLKNRLASHKHRKVKEIGEDPGKLCSEELAADGITRGYTRVRFWFGSHSTGDDLPIKIVSPIDENWDEAL